MLLLIYYIYLIHTFFLNGIPTFWCLDELYIYRLYIVILLIIIDYFIIFVLNCSYNLGLNHLRIDKQSTIFVLIINKSL